MLAFKFMIPPGQWVQAGPGVEFAGCVAVVLAETETEARASLARYAAENGLDNRWAGVAQVRQMELVQGAVLAWAQI